ncbi:MAG TPA: CDP-glycerol glycerophosphotransferase family protein [Candidatus Deferrimicrobiaceae bacterium]|nr:CDP-glycerol glycerophosphotransferase family protein [Candidatus Deferrimicrobiaceae bacterium]
MNRLEYVLSAVVLRVIGWLASLLPVNRRRVVLATARVPSLEGNLAYLYAAMRRMRPDLDYVLLLEPYSYGFVGKLGYLLRVIRGIFLLRTSRLFVVDNAYLPVHIAPHRPETTVVQVWHAVGALKRFGLDVATPPAEPERTFLHRYYDYVVSAGEAARVPYARALRTPVERVLPLGAPRTDFFFDEAALAAARERALADYPAMRGRRVVLYAPTFRGRGRAKAPALGFDASELRRALPASDVLVLKTHPNLDPATTPTAGFDVVADPRREINELLAATDVLVTDYSSSIFEWALLGRALVLLLPDVVDYEVEPGLYLDPRSISFARIVADPADLAEAIATAHSDPAASRAFAARHIGACDGHASTRFVERFLST